jgi:uncharacterized protein with HEPN domain
LSPEPVGGGDARDLQSLRDLVEFSSLAADLVSRGRDAYNGDRMLQLAAEALVARIGEAVARLDPAFVASHPEVPFRQARNMRNLVSHQYHRVDPSVVWVTLVDDIPPFRARVEGLLQAWVRP